MKSCYVNLPRKLEIVRKYFSAVRFERTTRILDVGGVQSYYQILKSIFNPGELYLLNINPLDIKEVRSRSFIDDATKLPFKNETLDVILSFDLIEHLVNPDDFLGEAFRILKWGVVRGLNT